MHKSHRQQISIIEQLTQNMANKLTNTIVALESDQVIEQMRNDKTLYQYKLTHIKEIIDQHFNFQKQISQLIQQNQHLKESLANLEQKIIKKDMQFNQAIDMIEQSAKKHTKVKQEQISQLNKTIRELQQKIINKSDLSEKISLKTSQLSQMIDNLENEKQKLRKQMTKLKQENMRLLELGKKQKNLKKQIQSQNQKAILTLKQQHQREVQQYELMIKKMHNDMLIIKTQWQKKCIEAQKNIKQFYQAQFVKLDEKKSRELIQHIQTIKQGKPVIIKQDEDILTTRIQSFRRQYDAQIQRLEKQSRQKQQLYQILQNTHIAKVRQIQNLTDAFKAVRSQLQTQKQNWMNEKQKSKREIQKLKAIVLEFERSNKDAVLTSQAKQSEIIKLNDQIKFIEKKLEIANRNINQQKNIVQSKQDDLEVLKAKLSSIEESQKKSKKGFENMQNELETKNKKVQNLSKQVDKLNGKISELEQQQENLKSQIKKLKGNRIKYRKVVDKIFIQIKNSEKQLMLIKQEIKYLQQLHRKKNLNDFDKFVDQIEIYRQNTQRECKNRMNDLINQIQQAKQAEHTQFQIIIRERQNLKRQVSQLEELFERKQRQVQEAKRNIINSQTEQIKRTMLQQVQRQKLKNQRLEQQIINNQKQYHRKLEKVKNEVKDAVRTLTNKWTEQIIRLEQDNKRKDIQLQRIVDKVQHVINDNEESKGKYQNERQQVKRFRKKYETLKQQKDEQINDLIKRLERESKHKIALEKQLRTIRSQLNKGQKHSKQYSQQQNKMGNNCLISDREKQISQIRDLIARTYQVVGEKPEKDIKLDRKRGA